MDKKLLSIVVPCFNEECVIKQFYETTLSEIAPTLNELECELIFVDDGSRDNTLNIIKNLANEDERVKYISFSRNFGKEAAIYAGLRNSKGDYVVLMDADLQHPPKYINDMYNELKTNSRDSVAMKRAKRRGIRSFFSNHFYKSMRKWTNTDIPNGATDFRLMTRQFVEGVLSLSEYNRFTKGIFGWVGFDTYWMTYPDTERAAGKSKWRFRSLLSYSMEGIVAFSTKPLIIASFLGILLFLISIIMMLVFVVKTIIWGDPVAGFPTLISVILMIGGLQLLFLGILGQYFAKAYMEVKGRPIYIEKESNVK